MDTHTYIWAEIIISNFSLQIKTIGAFSSKLASDKNDDVFKSNNATNKMKMKVDAHHGTLFAKSAFDKELVGKSNF